MAKFVVKTDRVIKAKKIEAVINSFLKKTEISDARILDIGCGTGEIVSYFKKNNNLVYAVDAMDQRINKNEMDQFYLVDSAKLPFESEVFDVIFSNHVIEHIKDQDTHLQEINRCLKPEGVCYFATPNKNFPIEPHHKIPFIHYLGNAAFHWILKRIGVYQEDLFLLSYGKMKRLLIRHGYEYSEYTAKVMKNPVKYSLEYKVFNMVPLSVLKAIQVIAQTNIFILKKKY